MSSQKDMISSIASIKDCPESIDALIRRKGDSWQSIGTLTNSILAKCLARASSINSKTCSSEQLDAQSEKLRAALAVRSASRQDRPYD